MHNVLQRLGAVGGSCSVSLSLKVLMLCCTFTSHAAELCPCSVPLPEETCDTTVPGPTACRKHLQSTCSCAEAAKTPHQPSLELSVSLGQVAVKWKNEDTREVSHISLAPCSPLLLFIQLTMSRSHTASSLFRCRVEWEFSRNLSPFPVFCFFLGVPAT